MSKEDICTEHMGKYPVIFCDFKVRVYLPPPKPFQENLVHVVARVSAGCLGRECFRNSGP